MAWGFCGGMGNSLLLCSTLLSSAKQGLEICTAAPSCSWGHHYAAREASVFPTKPLVKLRNTFSFPNYIMYWESK